MIVAAGDLIFLSQRTFPRMVLIKPELEADHLRLSAPGVEDLRVPLTSPGDGADESVVQARVWLDLCESIDDGDLAAEWLSTFLKVKCRLVHLRDGARRAVHPMQYTGEAELAFEDAFPLHLVSEASVENLNSKLETPVPTSRFRPNIVLRGGAADEEDAWKRIRVGDVELEIAKACPRCTIVSLDQETGEKRGPEPLQTLAMYKKVGSHVNFGMYAIHRGMGEISSGDRIEVLE